MEREKAALREEGILARRGVTGAMREAASAQILEQFLALREYRDAACVFVYIDRDGEVPTAELIAACRVDGKRVAAPCTKGAMEFRYFASEQELLPGRLGILEPVNGEVADADEDALVLLPGVAFSADGRRVGHGGGCYDRYLAAHPAHPVVAVAFEEQVFPEVPEETYDQRPDVLITQAGVRRITP